MDIRHKGFIDYIGPNSELYMVGCHVNHTVRLNDVTSSGGTYNWGGISYNISGNIYLINAKVGFKLENDRGSVNWFVFGWKSTKSYCHYYGDI